jgi:hypothetical protein
VSRARAEPKSETKRRKKSFIVLRCDGGIATRIVKWMLVEINEIE